MENHARKQSVRDQFDWHPWSRWLHYRGRAVSQGTGRGRCHSRRVCRSSSSGSVTSTLLLCCYLFAMCCGNLWCFLKTPTQFFSKGLNLWCHFCSKISLLQQKKLSLWRFFVLFYRVFERNLFHNSPISDEWQTQSKVFILAYQNEHIMTWYCWLYVTTCTILRAV